MPIIAAAPPQRVPIFSGFDYVTIDEVRRRVFAAHPSSRRLLIVDGQSGRIAGQIEVGQMHGVVVDPASGEVFTGNGTDRSLSKVDPVAMKVLAKVYLPGNIDAIAYDAPRGRIYADQQGGASVYVVDDATMKLVGTITMPANELESPAIDPRTGLLYQNLANGGGFAIVDPTALRVMRVVRTPQLQNNHPLFFAIGANQVIVGGVNGVLSSYTPDGTHVGDANVQPSIDQCSTGSEGKLAVCAGRGVVTVIALQSGAAPSVIGRIDTGHRGLHTVGIDERSSDIWVVWADTSGDWVQRLTWNP